MRIWYYRSKVCPNYESARGILVADYILPRLKEMQVDNDAWRFVNIGIGANDIVRGQLIWGTMVDEQCSFCLSRTSGC